MHLIKRIVFVTVIAIAAIVLLEVSTALIYRLFQGVPLSRAACAAQIEALAAGSNPADATPRAYDGSFRLFRYVEALHPYLGYVRDPNLNEGVNAYGYFGASNPVQKRREGQVIVAIFGGSFAQYVYLQARDTLAAALNLTGEVVVVNCAVGGFKQPQQALELVYLLAAGAEFDIVINLDGFNDVALPVAENIPKGVHPMFPQAWFYRAAGIPTPDELVAIGRVALLREQRAAWAHRFACPWLQRSRVACVVWKDGDARMEKKIHSEQRAIAGSAPTNQPYSVTGPPYTPTDEASTFEYLARVWKTSSLEMDVLCRAHGARYFHFLQPNQYVEESKPMSDEERAAAFDPAHIYRQPVAAGYPYLRAAGEELTSAGVSFHDLTMIFSNHPEPLYSDTCCHLNPAGCEIVAQAIGSAISR